MTKRYKQFVKFPSCCGAGFDPDAARFIDFGLDKVKRAVSNTKLAFVLTDIDILPSIQVCDGIWLVENGELWTSEQNPKIELGRDLSYMGDNTSKLNNKCYVIHGFTNSTYNPYMMIKSKTREAVKLPSFAILAGLSQHRINEPILLELGWTVISRRISPKTGNKLSLFYHPPGALNGR